MKHEILKATGNLVIELRDEFGVLKTKREVKNLVVTVGRRFIASRIANSDSALMSHMAIGTGTTLPSAADEMLASESARVNLTGPGAVTDVTVTYSATFPANTPAADAPITEAAIFNAATGGSMLCRTTFDVVNKSVNDTLTINWNVTINAA